ncbi:MAG TPA: metal-dependent hydrolase [Deltaproteobacteria bacterium]|nr:metal-dependent hydrolase [Deltaproteobacteria bacterium]
MAGTKITWLGHAGFRIVSPEGKVILIDPWFEGNPLAPFGVNDLKEADLLLVTHDHFDHSGDAALIAINTGATIVGMPETMRRLCDEEGVPESQIVLGTGMNIGGTYREDGIEITMVQAFHSSQTGAPAGYIVRMEDEFTIYHAGDTGIFGSMQIWGELFDIDLALLPIGSVFTMDPLQAAMAAKLLRAKRVIPMHYKTFPVLVQDAASFEEALAEIVPEAEAVVAEVGREMLF